eukprot:g30207.t1
MEYVSDGGISLEVMEMAANDPLDVDASGMVREVGRTNDIINIPVKELWVGAGKGSEQGIFHVLHKETGLTGAHVGTHRQPSDLKKMTEIKIKFAH